MNPRQYLEDEIQKMRTELSVTIPEEIQQAVELGDLRENTEFSSAITRQNFVGLRLEQLLKRAAAYRKIEKCELPTDAVNVGSLVKLRNLNTDEIEYIRIVLGDIQETDDKYEEVTIASPIGQALKNRKIKEEVVVSLPFGKVKYRILQIQTIHTLENTS